MEYDKYKKQDDQEIPDYLLPNNESNEVPKTQEQPQEVSSPSMPTNDAETDVISKDQEEPMDATSVEPVKRDGPCAYKYCIKPKVRSDREFRFIMCGRNSCKKWSHLDCIGLDYDKNYKNMFFACPDCWGPYFDEVFDSPPINKSNNTLSFKESVVNGRIQRRAAQNSRNLIIKLAKEKHV